MDPIERQQRIAFAEKQFLIHQSYATYWQAMATTGAAKHRQLFHAWEVPFTDEEKVAEALATSLRHLHHMAELNDTLDELRREE